MEELKKLYDVLVREGKYTKTFEEFQAKWSQDDVYRNKVYDVVSRDRLYTKDRESFFKKYSASTPEQQTTQKEVEAPVKKKFALESSSEVGSSELSKSPKQQAPLPQLTQEGFKKAMTKKTSVPTDMSGKPIFDAEKSQETKKIFDQITEENKQLQAEKKKYEDVFDKQLNIKPKVEDSQYLKNRLATINTDLINREEEYVVPELEYQFGDLGFKFEESGATGDWVKVTAPNGKTTEISLDNLFDSKSKAQSEILQKFIKDNAPAKGLFALEKTMREQDVKFNSEKEVDDYVKVISNELNNLNKKQKEFLVKKSQFEKELNDLGSNPSAESLYLLEKKRQGLKSEMDSLLKEEDNIKLKARKLDAAVGKYTIAKSKQGTWGGGIANAFLEGASSMSSGITNLVTDIQTEIAPTGYGMLEKDLKDISIDISKKLGFNGPLSNQTVDEWKKTLTEDQLDAWEDEVDDYIKKDLKSKLLPAIRIGNREVFGDADTTKQWSNLKEQDFWGGAILGVSKSLPAMIGGAGPAGWAQRTAQMYAQISDGLAVEMEQDPAFKDISENEKLAITLPIGIVSSVLEAYGFRNVMASKGFLNSLTLRVIGKSGRGVTAKSFRELVENEVESMMAKGLLTMTAAGAAEFETGALQELSETGFKELYNEIKGKEMFNTPESIQDLMENVVVAGAQEAVGGFVLGTPTAISTAFSQKGFLKMDDVTFETFANMANDEKLQSAYIASLKDKITRGIISEKEAKERLNNYRNSVGLFRQLPEGLTTQQQKEAMNLLKEKRDLENYINGKDPALVVRQKNRIGEINDSLTKLSETNAVQEQSTTEVPVQSETGVSEQVEERVSEPKPEVITEQGTQEEEVTQTIIEALNEPSSVFVYDGKKGQLTTIGQTVVLETPTEIIEEEVRQPSAEREGKSVRKGKRKQRTLRQPKEPLTKAEREAIALVQPAPKIDLGEDIARQVGLPPAPEGLDIVTETAPVSKEYDSDNENNEENMSVLSKVLDKEGIVPPAEPMILESGNLVSVTYRGQDFNSPETTITFNKNKNGAWSIKGYKVEKTEPQVVSEQAETEVAPVVKNPIEIQESRVESAKSLVQEAKTKAAKKKAMTDLVREENRLAEMKAAEKVKPTESKVDNEISQLNKDADYYASEIENIQEEIAIEKSNTKEGLVELRKKVKKEIEEVKKDKSLSRDEKIDKIEEIKYQIENFKEEQESIIEQYKNDLKDAKAELKKIEKKLAKLSGQNNVNELLDLDTKKKDGLNRVLDFLNKIDDSLDMDPNELNDITRVMTVNTAKIIVKTLKTLVNAGITLKEAIDKVAEIHSITPDKIIDALDIISKINENKSEGISEMEAPGYNNLSKEIDNMISNDSTIDEVLDYVQSSDVYKNATDVQRELLVRDVRKRFGLRQKSAPSVAKLFGKIKDVTKITMTEKAALAKQLRDKARGARESIVEWKKQSEELTEELKKLVRTGKISVVQSSVILNKFAKVNIFSRKSVDRFTDYMVKVINKADYANKLDKARNTLSSIKKLSKNADKNADLRAVGKEFSKIEPSMVEDIEEYNNIASKLETAIDGSKVRGQNTNIVDTVNIDEVYSYIEKTLAEQEEKLRQEKIDEIQDLYGVDASEFSAEEIDAMLEEDSDKASDNEKIVRATIKKAFDIYSSVIKEMLRTGVDPFTGEEVSFTEKEIDLIERFMGIDTDTIKDPKEVLRMVDSLINFIQNKSTAGMLKSIKDFEAIQGSESVVKKGIKGIRLRKYFSPYIGRVLGEKVTTLPVLFEKMFKGVTRAMSFEEAVGIADLINEASKSETEVNKIVKEYIAKFYTKKANGESYNSAYNDVERGVFAHVNRSVIGTEARRKQVFEKRKQEVLNTIKLLETSTNDSEVQLAEVIKKVYDKILDGSENANDVRSKTDPENVNGVEFWISKWDSKFDALSDLAKDFYNKILGRDLGYTPDRVIKLQDKRGDMDLEDIQSQFLANTDEVLYDKKSGSLMDKQENRKIPKDMYIDFSFDKKNANAMYDALTDLYTAPEIRKVGTFLKSDNFRKIFPSRKDANLVDKRIKKFVRIVRRKTPYSSSEISKVIKIADKVAKFGVTAALTSASQPFKQTIPVMVSTLINSGSLGMGINLDKGFNDWISNLGYAISNRGIESQAEIESINKLIERAAEKPAAQALKEIEKLQEKVLQIMLVNPDVWIARAAFKAYYEQHLKRQGLQSSNINYKNHQVNKEAADYAQRMVDRQQNISNHALAGDLYTSESNAAKILVKTLAPFSSFRLNQSARLGSDLSTLEYWNTSTKEDKIIALRSIAGYAAESATFRAIQIGTSVLLYNLAAAITGQNVDDEDEEKYINNLLKGAGMSAALDTFSPIPSADPFVQDFISSGVDVVESFMNIPEDEKLKLFGSQEQSALKMLGTYGIAPQRAKEIFELGKLAYTAKYEDRYGKEKEISRRKADELKKLIPIMIATSVTGIASPDAASISRNAIRQAKVNKKVKDPDLGDYENKTEMKEKNPRLYKRTFGKGSLNYREKKREEKLEKRRKRFGAD